MTETTKRAVNDYLIRYGFIQLSLSEVARIDLKFEDEAFVSYVIESDEMYLNKAYFITTYRAKVELQSVPSRQPYHIEARQKAYVPFPLVPILDEDTPQQKNFVVGFGG